MRRELEQSTKVYYMVSVQPPTNKKRFIQRCTLHRVDTIASARNRNIHARAAVVVQVVANGDVAVPPNSVLQ